MSRSQSACKDPVSITPKITELISVTIGVILIFRATEDLIKWNEWFLNTPGCGWHTLCKIYQLPVRGSRVSRVGRKKAHPCLWGFEQRSPLRVRAHFVAVKGELVHGSLGSALYFPRLHWNIVFLKERRGNHLAFGKSSSNPPLSIFLIGYFKGKTRHPVHKRDKVGSNVI